MLDLLEKEITVTQVKLKAQQMEYVSRLRPVDRADLTQRTGAPRPIEVIEAGDFTPKSTPQPRVPRTPRPVARRSVVLKGCRLNVTTPKIAGIYEELKILQLTSHVHAIGVLLRVFLEMSVDDYRSAKRTLA